MKKIQCIQNPESIKLPVRVERIKKSGSGEVGEIYTVVRYDNKNTCFYTKEGKSHCFEYLKLYSSQIEEILDIEKVL